MDGITYLDDFIDDSLSLFEELRDKIEWDERMKARFTASFGVAYNYSQISYPFQAMPEKLTALCRKIDSKFHFEPNNCLINYYPDGKSKMGFHSDQINILAENTGIIIISLGEIRTLKFRKIDDADKINNYELVSGSLIYMTQEIQEVWQHSITASNTEKGRMSLTFRKIRKY